MSRHARAALAAVVAAFVLAAPATAGERATLKVSVRVVDRCTVEVPPRVPPGLLRKPVLDVGRLVRHDCHGRPPLRVEAARVLVEQLRARLPANGPFGAALTLRADAGRVDQVRHSTRADVVLITITY